MKIEINLTKREYNHILPTHDFYDCCSEVSDIMKKVQNAVVKKLKEKEKKKNE